MNKIVFFFLLFLLSSCFFHKEHCCKTEVIGFEKFDKRTIILIDNMNKETIPEVLNNNYYKHLTESDFYKPKVLIQKNDSLRFIHIKSKQAKHGYLQVMRFSYDFIVNHKNVIFILNNDTIKNHDDVMRLVKLRKKIIEIDTVAILNNYIKINTMPHAPFN